MRLPLDFLESWVLSMSISFSQGCMNFGPKNPGQILPTTPNHSKEKHGANVTQYTLVVEWLVPHGGRKVFSEITKQRPSKRKPCPGKTIGNQHLVYYSCI